MSNITIRKTFDVNGTPKNVDSFTVGVVTTTGQTVVAAGTPMNHDGTGQYSYSFVDFGNGTEYQATLTFSYGGNTSSWTEAITGSANDSIPLPALTGDYLADTLASLLCERLRIARGPLPVSYTIHGHRLDLAQAVELLDKRIANLRQELAQTAALEEWGVGW